METTLQSLRRKEVQDKEVLCVAKSQALDRELGDSLMYDLVLMHGRTARRKAAGVRKKEPRPVSSGGFEPERHPSSAEQIHQLCEAIKADTRETLKRFDRKLHGYGTESAKSDFWRDEVEMSFRNSISNADQMAGVEELVSAFGHLAMFLIETYGTLRDGMGQLERLTMGWLKPSKKLTSQDWERGLRQVGLKIKPSLLDRIFEILDKDGDGEITADDVARFEPMELQEERRAAWQSTVPREALELESGKEKAFAQLVRQRRGAVRGTLLFSLSRYDATASMQEIRLRKEEQGKLDQEHFTDELARRFGGLLRSSTTNAVASPPGETEDEEPQASATADATAAVPGKVGSDDDEAEEQQPS